MISFQNITFVTAACTEPSLAPHKISCTDFDLDDSLGQQRLATDLLPASPTTSSRIELLFTRFQKVLGKYKRSYP